MDEVNNAAVVSDHKSTDSKRKNHFAVFTPSRNYHLQAFTEKDAQDWVDDIQAAVKITQQQAELNRHRPSMSFFRSPNFQSATENATPEQGVAVTTASGRPQQQSTPPPFHDTPTVAVTASTPETELLPTALSSRASRVRSPSPSPNTTINTTFTSSDQTLVPTTRRPHLAGYHTHSSQRTPQAAQPTINSLAAEEAASLSLTGPAPLDPFTLSRNMPSFDGTSITSAHTAEASIYNGSTYDFSGPEDIGFSSGASDFGGDAIQSPDTSPVVFSHTSQIGGVLNSSESTSPKTDKNRDIAQDLARLEKDRVLYSGYLLRLAKRYNQWRRKWVVLRKSSLCFYKSEDEYKLRKLVHLESIIDVMEIDPISKTKVFCMQIILPDKRLRFCAASEDDLTKWLVAIKAAVSKCKKEKENEGNEAE